MIKFLLPTTEGVEQRDMNKDFHESQEKDIAMHKHTMPIRNLIITVFVLIMIVAATSIAYIIFSRWHSSAEATMARIADNIDKQIHQQVTSFMDEAASLNETNHKLIRDGILDIQDIGKREQYFVGALQAFDDKIYSFSYGTEDGYYYGARRNKDGLIEIMRNDASTGGNSWYYTVGPDLRAKELAEKKGQFDPRIRPWYQAAIEAGGIAFSPPYKHFVMEDLTVSAAIPVYDSNNKVQGVMGTHLLLSGIGEFLEMAVKPFNGYAIIVERESGLLIANSLGSSNFTVQVDGSFHRKSIDQIGDESIRKAWEEFKDSEQVQLSYMRRTQHMYASMRGYKAEGIDWIVISVVPGGFLLDQVNESIITTTLLIMFAIIIIVVIYHFLTAHMLKPVEELLNVTKALALGDLSKRVPIRRNDEIGQIATSLNDVADTLQQLFNNLEQEVHMRTQELQESRDQLTLILNSSAEGIYGIDTEDKCTFCNKSALDMLGYDRYEELLGKNMHEQIHHTMENGQPFPIESCRIFKSFQESTCFIADNEVFWRKDGTAFPVSYQVSPQMREDKVVGGVITFSDITERREKERQVEYLRYHDSLTGLYNRNYFEEHYPLFDTLENLPLSLIFADINGLKMTNDIFGHWAGDALIKKSADSFKKACPQAGFSARLGGDEFIMVLPRTSRDETQTIMEQITSQSSAMHVASMRCSLSLGSDTKEYANQSFTEIMMNSENRMYQDKTKNKTTRSREILKTLQEALYNRSSREKEHAQNVRELAGRFASVLGLSEAETNVLKRSAYLHDIGKVTLDNKILSEKNLSESEIEEKQQHPAIGYRILSLFDDTLDLAEYVYGHHEHWDGSGYPRGLKGDQIPFISRILCIIEAYERIIDREGPSKQAEKKAIDALRKGG
ncbi:HD domain-containing phosphohydrolase, partial [Sphaerochaeta sp. S2]|uniref:HD domain-containing phosphohydrolase n=1 Tax=Sphaerochaeta sp. S2 TaxID=2798868 RepID=UPI0018E9CA8E